MSYYLFICLPVFCLFVFFLDFSSAWASGHIGNPRCLLVSQALGLKRLSLCGFSSSVSQSRFPSCCLQGRYFSGSPSHFCQTGHCSFGPRGLCKGPCCPDCPQCSQASVGPRPAPARCLLPPSPRLTTGFDESNPLSGWDLPQPAGQREGFPCRSRQAASAAGFGLC